MKSKSIGNAAFDFWISHPEAGGPSVRPKKYSITRTRGGYKVTLEVVSERPVSKAALITYSDTLIPTWLFNKLD